MTSCSIRKNFKLLSARLKRRVGYGTRVTHDRHLRVYQVALLLKILYVFMKSVFFFTIRGDTSKKFLSLDTTTLQILRTVSFMQ